VFTARYALSPYIKQIRFLFKVLISEQGTPDSGFRRDVDVMCALLGCYAALSGSSIPTFRDNCRSHLQGSRNLGFLDP
jgi:hypothetical protein